MSDCIVALANLLHQNKRRIFLAYYGEGDLKNGWPTYHVSILSRPHPLKPEARTSVSLHARSYVPPFGVFAGQEVWYFESKPLVFVTPYLSGLVYLGKLPAGKLLGDLVNTCMYSVPVSWSGSDEKRYCIDWVCDALEVRIFLSALS